MQCSFRQTLATAAMSSPLTHFFPLAFAEFSQDTSRGDGLRGWCKSCEAEARSTRYKKRKAAAQAAAAARRR